MTESLNEQSVDALLTKLGTDDDFRTAFLASPMRAIASLGILATTTLGLGAGLIPMQATESDQDLASKETFLTVRDELRRQHARAPFEPISLDFSARVSKA